MLKSLFFISSLLLLLTGCSSLPESQAHIQISKSLNGKQCETQGTDLSVLKQQLQAKHIRIYAESVGDDGMMRAQVCGAPDGKIAIFRIDQTQLAQAQALGFMLYPAQ